jgi:hypothetical protein
VIALPMRMGMPEMLWCAEEALSQKRIWEVSAALAKLHRSLPPQETDRM